ncbi:GNAT family N-acetyltransferase [Virgibacillus kekensis]|uniref:GNAT family N-acetyltransferase n=1 Tax=Virgibacillus kekensis TaxID=202261 RepID=A0ABV9DKK0_9BACI
MEIKVVEMNEEKQDSYKVRTAVFVDEQNVPPEHELDEHDEGAIHLVGYENDTPVAASRVRFLNDYGKLERICVLKEHRGKHFGVEMIEKMEDVIQRAGYSKAKLNAQDHAIAFYERLNYRPVSDVFMDAGIPHVTMIKEL